MSELTAKNRNSLIAVVIIVTAFMLGFQYETIINGIFPDYSFEPTEGINECGPSCLREYMGNYQNLK